ncbi:MAG: hypothetical protein ACYC61_02460 [Isosphaeraceae bacterium]
MRRVMGPALAVLVVLAMGQVAWAQAPALAPSGSGVGAFGPEYTQAPPSNSLILDRWWMLEATPVVGALPPTTANVAVSPAAQPSRAVVRGRAGRSLSRSRAAARRVPRGTDPEAIALPTGSLAWPRGPVVPLYSPANRYASYGYGYAVSPYGSMDYGAQYKGMAWGN